MTEREEQRSQLRAERIASEQADSAAHARRRRQFMWGGGVAALGIAAVVVIVIALGASGGHTPAHASASAPTSATAAAQRRVSTLLAGIPESPDDVLGRASARFTIIEYGDLECVVCDSFAVGTDGRVSDGTRGSGIENAIIDKLVKTGRAKLVYDALDTATSDGVTPTEFVPQQVAAYAAGLQDKAWYYIELFYNEQHPEGTDYVNQSFLDGIARQVPGLNYAKWRQDSKSPKLSAQVLADVARGTAVGGGAANTPTVVVQSKRAGAVAAQGIPTLLQVEAAMQAVQ